MKNKYIYIYNNLIELTRNKELYKDFKNQDIFSDRLIYFLLHFAFFFKIFKNDENKKTLQEIYDFTFRQLELSIREIGYGDQSINKKMKDYLNLFHDIIDKIHFWDDYSNEKKTQILKNYALNSNNSELLLNYFENYSKTLKKNTLNNYIKSVSNR
ncbi:ubiquinol-cytochrome C chaperone family protein [Candidatus Pelagibacter sp.]|uniref:ubiquinol-cytochrome C chaperone family protein n=1 Tax=Candidatus Pelagibacter sp. TaxID=2024849 RepID=UPI003F85B09E